jgi:hypothetical protein
MDEKISTFMACIWSCMYLTLLCTSTQSNHFKWVSGGGIISTRCPKSRWLKAVKTCTIRWTDGPFFTTVGSSGAPPRQLAVASRWHMSSDACIDFSSLSRRFIQCWRLHGKNLTASKHTAVGWTAATTVGSSGASACATRCSLFRLFNPPDRPTLKPTRPSVHPVLLSLLLFLQEFIRCN